MPPPDAAVPSRRDAIMLAATELIARQGFNGVGMRAIAEAVGIQTSSLYHHFPSKVDLLKAISLDATQRFVEAHIPMLEAGGSPAERLREVLRRHVVYFQEHRAEEAVGLAHLRELSQLEPQSFEAVQEVRRRYQHAVQRVIEEGVQRGDFHVADARLACLQVLGFVNSIGAWYREDGALGIEAVAEEYAAVAVDRILGAGR